MALPKEQLQQRIDELEKAAEAMRCPDIVKMLANLTRRYLADTAYKIALMYTYDTRDFTSQLTDQLNTEHMQAICLSLTQAAALMTQHTPDEDQHDELQSLIDTDAVILVIGRDVRRPEEKQQIAVLKTVFGSRLIFNNVGKAALPTEVAASLLNEGQSRIRAKLGKNILTTATAVLDELQIEVQWKAHTEASIDHWENTVFKPIEKDFSEAFLPEIQEFVKHKLQMIFPPPSISNPILHNLIQSRSSAELKATDPSVFYNQLKNLSMTAYTQALDGLSQSCASQFVEFLQPVLTKFSAHPLSSIEIRADVAFDSLDPVDIQPSMMPPNFNLDPLKSLVDGLTAGLYPTAFATISAISMAPASGGMSLIIPPLVAGAFSANQLRVDYNKFKTDGVHAVQQILNEILYLVGQEAAFEFQKILKANIELVNITLEETKRDLERNFALQKNFRPTEKTADSDLREACEDIYNIVRSSQEWSN